MQGNLRSRFSAVRNRSAEICKPLEVEDYVVQPLSYVSPPKWHLGHTTWFFEYFILLNHLSGYRVFNQHYNYLFNSYYNTLGQRVNQEHRGTMSRPTVEEVYAYRAHVDRGMAALLDGELDAELIQLIEIGINHEEQHQELLAYDIKYILGTQPLMPPFASDLKLAPEKDEKGWIEFDGGLYDIGHQGPGFCYDNELPRHKAYLHPFAMEKRLVTNEEYLSFMEDGGYRNHPLWHSDGWDYIQTNGIKAPLYWQLKDDRWHYYNFEGLQPLSPEEPVMHLSFYEAWAYAEWCGKRLPTEFEWEIASSQLHWGKLWEWTNSAYLPYPGYRKQEGALGEYNGKFMVNQMVLRGASFATPAAHARKSYRNFFHSSQRWMFSGMRLCKSL